MVFSIGLVFHGPKLLQSHFMPLTHILDLYFCLFYFIFVSLPILLCMSCLGGPTTLTFLNLEPEFINSYSSSCALFCSHSFAKLEAVPDGYACWRECPTHFAGVWAQAPAGAFSYIGLPTVCWFASI